MHVHIGAMLKETHERVEHLRQRQQPQLKQKIQDDRKKRNRRYNKEAIVVTTICPNAMQPLEQNDRNVLIRSMVRYGKDYCKLATLFPCRTNKNCGVAVY